MFRLVQLLWQHPLARKLMIATMALASTAYEAKPISLCELLRDQ
jgi:hypothetical protein